MVSRRALGRWPVPGAAALAVLVALASLAFLLFDQIELSEPSRGASEPIGPLYGPFEAEQTFTAGPGTLVGVNVRMATYARRNGGIVSFSLATQEGASRRATELAANLTDNALHAFRFEPLDLKAKDRVTFVLQSTTADPANAVTVWATARQGDPSVGARYGEVAVPRDLVFSPIYTESLGTRMLRLFRNSSLLPILFAILLMVMPGLAASSLLLPRRTSVGQRLAAAPALSIAVLALAVLFATITGVPVTGQNARLLLGIAAGAVAFGTGRAIAASRASTAGNRLDWALIAALAATAGGVAMRAAIFGSDALPAGADPYHHTLITGLIMERGGLPTSYEPYAPIGSFSYHFGFHALAALTSLAAGSEPLHAIGPRGLDAVQVVTPLVTTASALSVFFLARESRLGDAAAVAAAVVVALVSPYPAAFLTVGRYPEAAGMVILPVALALLVRVIGFGRKSGGQSEWRCVGGLGVLAAGLFLTHYRVAACLALIGLLALIWAAGRALRGPQSRGGRRAAIASFAHRGRGLIIAVILSLLLVAPWLWRLSQGFAFGLGGSGGRYGPEYYDLTRLGGMPRETMVGLGLLALAGLAVAVKLRQPPVLLLATWFVLQLAFSNPYWLPMPFPVLVDDVTVVTLLFFPASLCIGLLFGETLRMFARRQLGIAAPAGAAMLLAAALVGAAGLPAIHAANDSLATMDDLQFLSSRMRLGLAVAPPGPGLVLINAAVRHWQPDYVVPTDAGYWFPLFFGEGTTLLPMLYPAERGVSMPQVDEMERLAAVEGDLGSPEVVGLLRAVGVTEIFVGARGGPIDERALLRSPEYRLVDTQGGAALYQLLPATP
ncbi:MAG: hypothetical protein QOF51_4289 [Chloroflexota bacterium]|nr:hypothetical protein [Chloroflexota bacterium]